jgi:hypothetical protein
MGTNHSAHSIGAVMIRPCTCDDCRTLQLSAVAANIDSRIVYCRHNINTRHRSFHVLHIYQMVGLASRPTRLPFRISSPQGKLYPNVELSFDGTDLKVRRSN